MIVEVENFLPNHLLEKLILVSENSTNWEKQEMQHNLTRQRLSNPLKELSYWLNDHPLFQNFKYISSTLWKDDIDFAMDWHTDNERVKVAIQIYLDNRQSPGTHFKDRVIKYGKNRGYILFNNKKMEHCVPNQTPHQGRLSLYALFEPI